MFAAWLLRYLAAENVIVHSFKRRPDGTGEPYRSEIRLNSFRLKRICEDCNNGWMHRLEERVMVPLKELLNGARSLDSLDQAERQSIARWAAKTAIIESYAIGAEHPVDTKLLNWMRQNECATPGRFAVAACTADFGCIGHMQVGCITDLISGGSMAGNIIVLLLPTLALVCAFPLAGLDYRCLCDFSTLQPLWPPANSWHAMTNLPSGPAAIHGCGAMELLAERIELYQSVL